MSSRDWKRVDAVQPLTQRLAGHERHDEVGEPAYLARGEDRDDVRVLELRGEKDLPAESFAIDAGGEFRQHDFDHDSAPQGEVLGRKDS